MSAKKLRGVRVAAVSQADPKSAVEAQATLIKRIAAAEGLELIGIVDDSGKSAFDMSREGLNAILAAAAARRFDVVIVRDWARLARDPDDLQCILDSLAAGGVIVVNGAEFPEPRHMYPSASPFFSSGTTEAGWLMRRDHLVLGCAVGAASKPMADKVHITKRGIQALKWDGDVRQYVDQEIRSTLHVLRCACHIEADVTLGDIFHEVEQAPDLVEFLEQWSWCNVEAFHSEARKPATPASDLSYIEIAKYFQWDKHEAQENIHISGIGKADENGVTHYGLDFTPVNELVHPPVRLRPEMEIHRDHKKLGDAPCTFTLLDVLGEIYWEISFYGSPEDRDRQNAELQESMREVDEGRATLIPLNAPEDLLN